MTAEQGAPTGTVIGFIGLGNMGIPMARRIVAAGHHVRGYDTSAEAVRDFAALAAGHGQVTAAGDLAGVGTGADAVILMLPDSNIVERVVLGRLASEPPPAGRAAADGLLASLAPGTVIIDMSSSDPARTRAARPGRSPRRA